MAVCPRYIDNFAEQVRCILRLEVAGVFSLGTKGRIARAIILSDFHEAESGDWEAATYEQILNLDGFHTVRTDFSQVVEPEAGFSSLGPGETVFLIRKKGHSSASLSDRLAGEIGTLYATALNVAGGEIASQVNAAYLSSSSDTLGIRRLLAAALPRLGINHVAVIKCVPGGGIDVIAQFGSGRPLEDDHVAKISQNPKTKELVRDLGQSGAKHYRSLHEDPLVGTGGHSGHGPTSSFYINTGFYPADTVKKQSLSGIWVRGATSKGAVSWEDIFLLHRIASAVSVMVSVGSILTTRLIQLQRVSHSNGSILSSMTSSLNQAFSEIDSLLLAFRRNLSSPEAATAMSLALRARDHMNYLRLNVHQMQAKMTLSLWLEHEAGVERNLNLERFNILESLRDIMAYAPALVESWSGDYSGAAKPEVNLPNHRSVGDAFVRARRDIFEFAVLNVLENAVKYRSSDKPRFSSSIEHARDPVTYEKVIKVYLEDDGVGIAKDDVAHIFRSGWRSASHKRSDIPGQGQGLFQTRELLKLVGSDIRVISRVAPTTFCITIPIDLEGTTDGRHRGR